MSKSISHQRFEQILDELVCEYCPNEYCFLKKFVGSLHPEPIVLVQLKCLEKFKWEESRRENNDIGWNEAGMRWATQGYAAAFRKVFDEELSVRAIYERTLAEVQNNHP